MFVWLKSKFWDNSAENCFPLAANESESGEKNNGKEEEYSAYFFTFYLMFTISPDFTDSELELSLS